MDWVHWWGSILLRILLIEASIVNLHEKARRIPGDTGTHRMLYCDNKPLIKTCRNGRNPSIRQCNDTHAMPAPRSTSVGHNLQGGVERGGGANYTNQTAAGDLSIAGDWVPSGIAAALSKKCPCCSHDQNYGSTWQEEHDGATETSRRGRCSLGQTQHERLDLPL